LDLAIRMLIWFGVVWWGTKALDVFVPPSNQIFNAALAIAAMLVCLGRYVERNR
jgi:hypothetical protein